MHMIDTTEGIAWYQLIACMAAVKLESKGMRMTARAPLQRKVWAKRLGLKQNATYAVVIAAMQQEKERMEADAASKGIRLVK